MFYTAVGPS